MQYPTYILIGVFLLFFLIVVITLISARSKVGELFSKLKSEVLAFILAFGTTSLLSELLHFEEALEKLPPTQRNFFHHLFYILVLVILTITYRFLLSDLSNRLFEAIERKYSENNSKFAEYYSVLFNLQTHNDEYKVLNVLLQDYKRLSDKHQYLISLDAYIELIKNFFNEGYEAVGTNDLLPPFWLAPDFPNTNRLTEYIDFLTKHKDKIKYERISIIKDDATANNLVGFAMEQIEKSDGGKTETYLWLLDLVQSLDIQDADFTAITTRTITTTDTTATPATDATPTGAATTTTITAATPMPTTTLSRTDIQNNFVIQGISWNIGVRHLFNPPSYTAIQNRETEVDQKLTWFRENLLAIVNRKVKEKFKELQRSDDIYYCPKELFNQRIKTKYNWAEIAIFKNTSFGRKIGIAVVNNVDNAILIEVIVDENLLSLIEGIISATDFKRRYE